jgi:hypothetical protein
LQPHPQRFLRPHRAAAILTATVALGMVVGAAAHPLQRDRFRAEAVVAVQPGNSSASGQQSTSAAWRLLAETIKLPQVAQAVAPEVSGVQAGEISDRIETLGDPTSGLLRVRARGETRDQASELADEVSGKAASLLQSATGTGRHLLTSFDFESGITEGWTALSPFTVPASRLSTSTGGARTGRHALVFTCRRSTGSGCGPGVALGGFFSGRSSYRASVFVRLLRGHIRLRIVLGSKGADLATSPFRSVPDDKRYHELSVSWVPKRSESTAVLALQTAAPIASSTLAVDSTAVVQSSNTSMASLLTNGTESASTGGSSSSVPRYRYITLASASPVSNAPAATPRWILIGALLGLAAGIVACGSALAAERRRHGESKHEPHSGIEPVTGELAE